MGNCKDCKFWEQHNRGYHSNSKQWQTCGFAEWVDYDSPIGEDEMAFYADASDDTGLDAGVKTGPLFGCVKFKQVTK